MIPSEDDAVVAALVAARSKASVRHGIILGDVSDNTLVRSAPCPECGSPMLWTQNAWHAGTTWGAAYRCVNGHVLDPDLTRQCPACGLHDTDLVEAGDGRQQYRCLRCGNAFTFPRE